MSRVDEVFRPALEGKKVPVLTLDNKWHQLFTQTESNPAIHKLEKQLNTLLKRQGKLTTESKQIRGLKSKLRDGIVDSMDTLNEAVSNKEADKKLEDNRRLINECNDKLDGYQDELLELPKEIERVNKELMLLSMESCYKTLQENTEEIDKITQWIKRIRIELKKNVIRKQENEIKNYQLYSYMHDIFGAKVIEIFDMTYDPLGTPIKKKSESTSKT